VNNRGKTGRKESKPLTRPDGLRIRGRRLPGSGGTRSTSPACFNREGPGEVDSKSLKKPTGHLPIWHGIRNEEGKQKTVFSEKIRGRGAHIGYEGKTCVSGVEGGEKDKACLMVERHIAEGSQRIEEPSSYKKYKKAHNE